MPRWGRNQGWGWKNKGWGWREPGEHHHGEHRHEGGMRRWHRSKGAFGAILACIAIIAVIYYKTHPSGW